MMKNQLILLKSISNSNLECTNHTLFQTKMVEIDTLFQTKRLKNHTFGAEHTYIAYIRDYPPLRGGGGEKRVPDYESRCFRKRD